MLRGVCACVLGFFALVLTADAQLSPEDALKSFVLAEPGLKIELVAAEPLVESPCALTFDAQGRMFVAENRGYPNTSAPPQGRIALLFDDNGDGKMDRRTTFADGLEYPNGVLPWKDGVFITAAPDVLFLRDTNADGIADERRVVLTGFDTKQSTQLRVNKPLPGPDGWIYLASGLSGGRITNPARPDLAPLELKTDLRFHPDTGEFEAVDGRSQFGHDFDAWGNRFICMNRVPVQHVVLSSKVLRRNPHLAFSDTVQDCSAADVSSALRGDRAGVRLFPISQNITTADAHAGSFSAACAVTFWQGHVFSCDSTANLVHADRLEPRGSTFAAVPLYEGREFLASRDDWFRPVYLARGPGDALYIADMTRKVIEHPDYLPEETRKRTDFESGKAMGRVWRVRWPGSPEPGKKAAALPEGQARLREILSLADRKDDDAIERLAELAVAGVGDRWARAAVLSAAPGREAKLLSTFAEKVERLDADALDFVEQLGRSFAGVAALQRAFREASGPTGFERDGLGAFLCAAIAGATERTRERLAPEGDAWLTAILKDLPANATDAAEDGTERTYAIRVLGRWTWEKAGDALLRVALEEKSERLRATAVRALAEFDRPEVSTSLLMHAAWSQATPWLRETIFTALLARSFHQAAVLDLIERGDFPAAALDANRRRAFAKHPDTAVRERAAKIFGAPAGDRGAAFEKAKAALALKAEAGRGREVFRAACATCHRLEREGAVVGPDLFGMANQPKETILLHIVVPDHELAPGFAAYTCETKDGRTFAGVLASETAESVKLRLPGGAEETIRRADVKELTALPTSLMPAGLEALGAQALADLLAYLKGER